jgi:hypothetical protein
MGGRVGTSYGERDKGVQERGTERRGTETDREIGSGRERKGQKQRPGGRGSDKDRQATVTVMDSETATENRASRISPLISAENPFPGSAQLAAQGLGTWLGCDVARKGMHRQKQTWR